jgi:predicted component of type VI protein secretion system
MIARFPAASGAKPAAWLVGEEGPMAGKRVAIDRDEFWVGALENNHLHIANDPTVSGNHACLVIDHDVLGIYDHHSTNGTLVNGEPIGDKRALLRPGDRVKIGRTVFVVEAGTPGAGA